MVKRYGQRRKEYRDAYRKISKRRRKGRNDKDEFNEMVDENNCMKAQIEELKTELKKAKDAEKDHLLLQVRYDQILRASKELAQCLQYETGNGFIK